MREREVLFVAHRRDDSPTPGAYLEGVRATFRDLLPGDELVWVFTDQLGLVQFEDPSGRSWIVCRSGQDLTDPEVQARARLVPAAASEKAAAALEHPLTGRETEVLRLVARGMTAVAIGHALGISKRTVDKHLQNAYSKMECHDRLLAVERAVSLGIVSPHSS